MRQYWVYLLANRKNGTLYVGMTNDLSRRLEEHIHGVSGGFTAAHNVHRLVWFEEHQSAAEAIRREKTIKSWPRRWKVELIESANPDWNDLKGQLI